ncbi:hypothetical protein G3I23_40900, partial [Streptomyces sp. SID10115]|nr:hypothetical protein [Streptomyces sp. SID10115]
MSSTGPSVEPGGDAATGIPARATAAAPVSHRAPRPMPSVGRAVAVLVLVAVAALVSLLGPSA